MRPRRWAVLVVLALVPIAWAAGAARARPTVPRAVAAQAGEFVGTWKNKNASTNNVTKIVISISGGNFRIFSYGKCSPTDCDWSTYAGVGGPRTPPLSDADDGVIKIVWPFGFQTTTQTLTLQSSGTLQVLTHTLYSNGTTRDVVEFFANATDRKLQVSKTGTGSGTVTSNPAGINCGGSCSATFNYWTSVSLTAKPAEGSKFDGWEVACNGSSCNLKMSLDRSVTAKFNLIPVSFSVSRSGEGTVTSAPNGIGCGATCSTSFPWGTSVTLKATPASRWGFLGWSGDCNGTSSTCSLTVKTPVAVKASFGSVKLTAARVTAHWKKSRLSGTLVLTGEATKAAQLAVTITPTSGSGKPFVSRSIDVQAGTFSAEVPLPKRLLPGRFAVHAVGTMGGVAVPEAIRAIRVPAPREGVVQKEYISTTPKGPAVHEVPLRTPKLYAHFAFAPGAPSKLPLTVEWYGPRGTFVGKTSKPRARLVESTVSFPSNYPTGKKQGIWGCILRAGTVVVDDVFVRIS